ncbi:hypothetical protein [Salinithrix halophila]|uniref:IDEAL domain-containing protein n=1 Tax=Salinithrix halophila TaxID=1485204 RepID=A0ABV8JDU9_9BACL
MALDVLLYKKGTLVHKDHISESLHDALFKKNKNWGSYLTLRKLQDYYRTDVRLNRRQMDELVSELEQMKIFVDNQAAEQIDQLKDVLSRSTYDEAWIGGD